MNDRQEEKDNMYEACDAVLTDEATVVDEVIALAEAHDRLQENMDGIDEASGRKEAAVAGKGAAKRAGKDRLVDALHLTAGLLVAEGTTTGNPELIAQARYSRSSFLRTRDGRLPIVADAIHALATTHKTALLRRGFTDTQLEELKTLTDDFRQLSPAPKLGRNEKTIQVARLAELFTATDKLLKDEIDPMIRNLEKRHPDFVKRWFAARALDETPGTHASGPASVPAAGAS
ncbi:hypothetical protein [Flaviaesturariibacter aridisoli]|uniref:Uncharacterized protein n=1 Tax=Flaviaesturariibacter aridisoli TaxID=2545761 RepID=A0A4R4DYS9_9BACT|nr:hypothetical protein [Flaviaesturariibacter aridisoli]TCZ67090.1 hypothetical protein E0486_16255 [Flaviaesturariibacter aridisoli]